jgi:hypothetical protein
MVCAAVSPAGPAPTTTTSYSFCIFHTPVYIFKHIFFTMS